MLFKNSGFEMMNEKETIKVEGVVGESMEAADSARVEELEPDRGLVSTAVTALALAWGLA